MSYNTNSPDWGQQLSISCALICFYWLCRSLALIFYIKWLQESFNSMIVLTLLLVAKRQDIDWNVHATVQKFRDEQETGFRASLPPIKQKRETGSESLWTLSVLFKSAPQWKTPDRNQNTADSMMRAYYNWFVVEDFKTNKTIWKKLQL